MTGGDPATTQWPVDLRGVTESVVATRQPEGTWNLAALGLHAGDPVTARTWGDTRTRRNFAREDEGYVQFTRDPVTFVEAALSIREADEPLLSGADAWARVTVERLAAGESGGTGWVDWALEVDEAAVASTTVPTVNRGYNAVVEATVAASRLGVDAYDDATLRERLGYFEEVTRRCGGEREVAAFDRLNDLVGR